MLDTKLFKLLKILSKNELKSLSDFIGSPFFNKNEKVIALYTYIYGFANDFENPKMTFEKAHEFVFGKKAFKKEDLNKIFSMLTDLVKQFLAYDIYAQNPFSAQQNILNFYNRRGLETIFESEFEKSIQSLYAQSEKNITFYHNDYLFHQIKFENRSILKQYDNKIFDKINSALDANYYYSKTVLLCRIKYFEISKLISLLPNWEIEIDNFLANPPKVTFQVFALWFNALKMLHQPSIESYFDLLSNLKSDKSQLDLDNKVLIFRFLEITIDKLNFSFHELNRERNNLYKFQIEENLIVHNGIITPYIYRNIIAVAIRCQDFAWAKKFASEHRSLVLPSYQEKTDIVGICDAMISFEEKKYDDAIDILNTIVISDFGIKIDERTIRLKSYYELQYFDIFEDSINSYRKFLSENKEKLRGNILAGLRDFINFSSAIFKTLPKDTKNLSKIQAEIESTNFLPEKIWLLEKIKLKKGEK